MILFSGFHFLFIMVPQTLNIYLIKIHNSEKRDINDVNNSIKTIENTIESNLYEENFKQLLPEKSSSYDFNIFNRLNKLVENISKKSSSLEKITIHSSNYFWRKKCIQ